MNIGKNMKHCLKFLEQVNGWHSYASDRATVNAIKSLEKRQLVETNRFGQVRLKS